MFFADQTELKPFLPQISADIEVGDLTSDIEEVDREIIDLISQEQFDELKNAYETDTLTPELETLLKFVRTIEANLGYAKFRILNKAKIESTGEYQIETDTHKKLYRYEDTQINERLLEKGNAAIEQMLKFLERNEAFFLAWTASTAYTQFKSLFIKTASEFDEYININESRRIFLKLKRLLKETENIEIKKFLGNTTFAQIKADVDNVDFVPILEFLKPALAHLTWAKALRILPINLTAEGYYSFNYRGDQHTSDRQKTDLNYIQEAIENAKNMAEVYLAEAANYLNENLILFPNFTESAAYIAPDSPETERNTIDNKLFIL